MRQFLVVGSIIGLLGLAAPADAGKQSWYMALEAGIEMEGDVYYGWGDSDWGFGTFASVGREITAHLNIEAELGYRSTTDDLYDIDQTSLMLNAVYEIPLTKELSLSLGLGLGADRVHIEIDHPGYDWSDSEIEVASQIILGANWEISDGTEVVARYRYVEMITDSAIDNGTLTVGLRFDL